MAKPRWNDIQVRHYQQLLTGRDRLVALFRWLRGNVPRGMEFAIAGRATPDPLTVDWTDFPLHEAVEAMHSETPDRE